MPHSKRKKPVTKKFWHLLRCAPPYVRKRLIRSHFEVNYELPSEYTFKLAETQKEIEEALTIVYESYSLLGYIDHRPEKVHFNAYLCLPTTSILIVKFKDEVIGTMSIVPDSSLGLPSENTWGLDHIKSRNSKIAEISSLSIKKGHKSDKGHLLLKLCKFMYEYCVDVLKLDGIVIAATQEVEPFYTDLLLFKKIVEKTGQKHELVKGNRSTCCYLNFREAQGNYQKTYGKKARHKNLHHFFTEFRSPNIISPENHFSLQGLLLKKNMAITGILKRYPNLNKMFSPLDKLVIANLDPSLEMGAILNLETNHSSRSEPRISIRDIPAYLYHPPTNSITETKIVDISNKGFCLELDKADPPSFPCEKFMLILEVNGQALSVHASRQWTLLKKAGHLIQEGSKQDWKMLTQIVFDEIGLPNGNFKSAA